MQRIAQAWPGARLPGRLQGWPAAQEVTEDRRVFVLKPLEDLRKIALKGAGEAVRDPDLIADQAGGGARLAAAMSAKQAELQPGIARIVPWHRWC